MRNAFGVVVLALSLVGLNARAEETLEVKVGQKVELEVPGSMVRVALGDIEIAEVKTLGGDKLEVSGESVGTTKLLVWKRSGERVEYSVKVTAGGKDTKETAKK
ncbi:pilus assembly protein N-terminal domain-containing protein [Myxococcaceae bacterium GXIMD 01537]